MADIDVTELKSLIRACITSVSAEVYVGPGEALSRESLSSRDGKYSNGGLMYLVVSTKDEEKPLVIRCGSDGESIVFGDSYRLPVFMDKDGETMLCSYPVEGIVFHQSKIEEISLMIEKYDHLTLPEKVVGIEISGQGFGFSLINWGDNLIYQSSRLDVEELKSMDSHFQGNRVPLSEFET